jgi:hypothetical protein
MTPFNYFTERIATNYDADLLIFFNVQNSNNDYFSRYTVRYR